MRVLYDDKNLYVGIDCEQLNAPIVRRLRAATRRSRPTASGSTSTAGAPASARSTSRSTPPACCPTASTSTTPTYSSDWDAGLGSEGRATPTAATRPSSASRCRCCASRRCPCRTGGSRCGASSTRARRPTTGRSSRAAPRRMVPLFGRLDDLRDLRPAPRARAAAVRARARRPPRRRRRRRALDHGWSARRVGRARRRAHVTNELTLDAGAEPRLRSGRGRHRHPEPVDVRDVLPGEAAVLPGGDRRRSRRVRPLVYTRRIGRQPAAPALGAGETLVARPDPTPLYGAAKLVGTIGARTTVGLISALTGPNDVEVIDDGGARDAAPARSLDGVQRRAPQAQAGRERRGRRARDGGQPLRAADCRSAPPARRPARRPAATAAAPTTPTCSAPTGAGARRGRLLGRVAGGRHARCERPARARSPTARPSCPAAFAGGGSLYVGKEGGAHWLWSAWQHLAGRDAGVQRRRLPGTQERLPGVRGARATGRWSRGGCTVETTTSLQLQLARDAGRPQPVDELGLRDVRAASPTSGRSTSTCTRAARYFDDRETGDGTALQRPASAGVDRRGRHRSAAAADGVAVRARRLRRGGGVIFGLSGRLTLRALPQLELDVHPDRRLRERRAALRREGRAALAPRTDAISVRHADRGQPGRDAARGLHLHPELSLQLYTQLFLARVHYGPCFTVTQPAGGRVRLADLPPTRRPPGRSPTRERATLNINLVLRWEYRLGSTLFVVYTRAQDPALTPAPNGASFELRPLLPGPRRRQRAHGQAGLLVRVGPPARCAASIRAGAVRRAQRNRPTPLAPRLARARNRGLSRAGDAGTLGAISSFGRMTRPPNQTGGSP